MPRKKRDPGFFGYDSVDDDEVLFQADVPEHQYDDAVVEELAVRDSPRGGAYPQKVFRNEDNQIVSKQTLGRKRQSRGEAEDVVQRHAERSPSSSFEFDVQGFDVGFSEFDLVDDVHESRSKPAQTVDEAKGAPITTDHKKWLDDPAHYDYPGVDTLFGPDF